MTIDGDRRLLTPTHYNPRLQALISATEILLGTGNTNREQMQAQGITPALVADLYRYDMTGLAQAFVGRARPFLARSSRFDRRLHKRQMQRLTAAIWGLRRRFPTSSPTIGRIFGEDSAQHAQFVAMRQCFRDMFYTGDPREAEDPRQWLSLGTVSSLCELFEMGYLFSHNPQVMTGYDAWHDLSDNEDTYQQALDEFIAATKPLLRNR